MALAEQLELEWARLEEVPGEHCAYGCLGGMARAAAGEGVYWGESQGDQTMVLAGAFDSGEGSSSSLFIWKKLSG